MTSRALKVDILVKTDKGKKNYHFSSPEIIVGRSRKADLYIPLEGISRKHFKIIITGEGPAIVDLGALNRTLLNGEFLEKKIPTPFLREDTIEIQGVKISFSINIELDKSALLQNQIGSTPDDTIEKKMTRTSFKIKSKEVNLATLNTLAEPQDEKFNSFTKKNKDELKNLVIKDQTCLNELQKSKVLAFKEVDKEYSDLKGHLISESKKESQKIFDTIDIEKDKLLDESVLLVNKAKKEAEAILLHAEEEAREKNNNYQKILENEKSNTVELVKRRRQAEYDAEAYCSKLRDEAAELLKTAKAEAAVITIETASEVKDIKKAAASATEAAYAEADRVKVESIENSRLVKGQSDKILKNAYAAAMLISNTTQKNYEADEDSLLYEKNDFSPFEADHQNKVQNIFSLINKTSEEMDKVLKEKQVIYEEENKHLRESVLKKTQIKAREEAVIIKAQAESEAEEIIRNTYLHSKKIEIEACSRIKEKEVEFEEFLNISTSEIEKKSIELEQMVTQKKELQQNLNYLTDCHEKAKTQYHEEKERFESFFNESSERENDYIQLNNNLEIEYTDLSSRVSKAKKDLGLFEIESDNRRQNLDVQLRTLSSDKEKLLTAITPLQGEVTQLRKEKEELQQENYTFFENLNATKNESDNLKNHNEGLKKSIEENNSSIIKTEVTLSTLQKSAADLEFEYRNINSKLNIKKDESERERMLILKNARAEESKINREAALVRENKEINSEKEIAQLKRRAVDECQAIVSEGKKDKVKLISEGTSEAKEMRSKASQWIKNAHEEIDNNIKEVEKARNDGRLFLIEKKKEAESKYAKKIELANNKVLQQEIDSEVFIKKNEEDSNERLLLLNEQFQEKMKQREQLFKKEKNDFTIAIENKKHAIMALADANAKKMIEKSKASAHSLLSEAKAKEKEALAQKESILSSIETDSNALMEKLNKELNDHKQMAQKEISQMKVKELELQKQKHIETDKLIEKRKKKHVSVISENVWFKLQIKMKNSFGKQVIGSDFEKFKKDIEGIVDAVIFPDNNTSEEPRVKLLATGKITTNVRNFYIKFAIALLAPLILFTVGTIFPQFFPSIKNTFISSITTDESASDIFLQKEIEKKKNRPKFQPLHTAGFKENYTDNITYTEKYAELVVSLSYIDKWTISLNTYFVDELGLSDNLIVKVISYENSLHRQLIEIKSKINPSFEKQGIERMRDKEKEFTPKIKSLFNNENDFLSFTKFKKMFFNDFKKNKK